MRSRRPFALAVAAVLAFGTVACDDVDGVDDVTSDTRETGEETEADPGLEESDEQVTEDDEPVDDPAGVGEDDGEE